MNRRSVIRCILGLAAAPKMLGEIGFESPHVFDVARINARLVEIGRNKNWSISPDEFQNTFNKAQLSFMEAIGNRENITNTDSFWFEMRPKTIQS